MPKWYLQIIQHSPDQEEHVVLHIKSEIAIHFLVTVDTLCSRMDAIFIQYMTCCK